MSNSYFPLNYSKEKGEMITTAFNASDFYYNYNYVSFGELINYAKLINTNVFQNFNYFNLGIYTKSVNNVTDIALDFIASLTEDVQNYINLTRSQLNIIIGKVTKISYNNNVTNISDTLLTDKITCHNNINSSKVITLDMISTNIVCDKIICSSLKIIGIHLFINNLYYPLRKSQDINNLSLSPNNCLIHLESHFMIRLYDINNICIFEARNDTEDIIYNISLNMNNAKKINVYNNNILT